MPFFISKEYKRLRSHEYSIIHSFVASSKDFVISLKPTTSACSHILKFFSPFFLIFFHLFEVCLYQWICKIQQVLSTVYAHLDYFVFETYFHHCLLLNLLQKNIFFAPISAFN